MVIFIAKPGKDSYDQPSAYRPISLANYFLKCLERLCAWHVDRSTALHPIHENQHGFRPDRSTETAASTLLDHVESFVFNKAHCLTVFLDIRAAFDSVGPDHIKSCLEDHGADKHITEWYHNYLLHRNITCLLYTSPSPRD